MGFLRGGRGLRGEAVNELRRPALQLANEWWRPAGRRQCQRSRCTTRLRDAFPTMQNDQADVVIVAAGRPRLLADARWYMKMGSACGACGGVDDLAVLGAEHVAH